MAVEPDRDHTYVVTVTWTGNRGTGTSAYRDYARAHDLSAPGKPTIPGSSDPAFRGDRTRYNPEELLVASISSCHMLWYLHLCSAEGILVQSYEGKRPMFKLILDRELPGKSINNSRSSAKQLLLANT